MRKLLAFLMCLVLAFSLTFVMSGCDLNKKSEETEFFADSRDRDTGEVENEDDEDFSEDELSGIWNVVEGGDDHSIVIANGDIQIIDGYNSEIYEYSKPSDNVFKIEFEGSTWEFKYKNGLLYRYENGEADGYVYERTAYNSNK